MSRFEELLTRLNEDMDDVETTCREMVECAERDDAACFIAADVRNLLYKALEFCGDLGDVGRDYNHFLEECKAEARLSWDEFWKENEVYG